MARGTELAEIARNIGDRENHRRKNTRLFGKILLISYDLYPSFFGYVTENWHLLFWSRTRKREREISPPHLRSHLVRTRS